MKKTVGLLLAVFLLISLVGCGGGVEETSGNSLTLDGLHFDIFEDFDVETITELTQYHLSEDDRNDPTTIYMREYHMGESVLFMPITITNLVPEGDSDYRFIPRIRLRTHTGRLSIFEADTLNGRNLVRGFSLDNLPNYEGAYLQGYLAFLWEGHGEYTVEIMQGREIDAEFTFHVEQ